MTAPAPEGEGAARAMRAAIHDSGLPQGEFGYVNAHATSTPAGDESELAAIGTLFGRNRSIAVSATKSATGHLLGAAGGLEAIFTDASSARGGRLMLFFDITASSTPSLLVLARTLLRLSEGT